MSPAQRLRELLARPNVEIMPNSSDMLRRQTSSPVSALRQTSIPAAW